MLKNSKLYGSIIPADVHSLHIKDVTLGEKVELQILALTDHPVGRQDAKDSPNEGDSGIEASTVGTINSEWGWSALAKNSIEIYRILQSIVKFCIENHRILQVL